MNSKFKLFMVGIFLIIFLIKVIPNVLRDSSCGQFHDFLATQINGTVIQKYIDSSQHSYKTVVIKDSNAWKTTLLLDLELSGLYDKINVNDTLFKTVGSDSVFLISSSRRYFLAKADYGCRDSAIQTKIK